MSIVYPFTKNIICPVTSSSTNGLTVVPGGIIVYEISLVNVNSTGIDYAIVDTTPLNTIFISLVQTAGPPVSGEIIAPTKNSSGPISISNTNTDLLSGQVATFQIKFRVSQSTSVGTVISNTAQLIPTGISSPPQLSNTTTLTVGLGNANLSISTQGPSVSIEGKVSKYLTTIVNNGPSIAFNVVFNQEIFCSKSKMSIIQLTGPEFFYSEQSSHFEISTLEPNTTAIFETRVCAGSCKEIKVASQIFSSTLDFNTDNNTSCVTTTIKKLRSSSSSSSRSSHSLRDDKKIIEKIEKLTNIVYSALPLIEKIVNKVCDD